MVDEESLIDLVRENPVLYDLSHPDYVRTTLKDQTWHRIGSELGTNGRAVKELWRKLRERHREALRRQKMSKGKFPRPWMYQQHMDFLLPHMKNKSTCTSMEQELLAEILVPGDGETTQGCSQDEPQIEFLDEPEISLSADSNSPKVKRIKRRSRTAFIQTAEKRNEDRDELSEVMQHDSSQSLQTDALYQFFLSMYLTTKSLQVKYQRQIRNKLYEVVSQAEEQNEAESSSGQIPLL